MNLELTEWTTAGCYTSFRKYSTKLEMSDVLNV